MSWKLVYIKHAQKDAKKINQSGLQSKVKELLEILKEDPFKNPPNYEKLIGDLSGAYSRRINIRHRLVYQVLKDLKTIKILRMWSHYE
ncbi:MAG: Txe/YoeB family addiction module toxin [Candidatus Marinimicrobia bacterium]|nr:Txe/YoeB family addiction module toxin [Candidatus Neomarinimicrobiota bacterium]